MNKQLPFSATSHMPLETYHRLHSLHSTNATVQSQTLPIIANTSIEKRGR